MEKLEVATRQLGEAFGKRWHEIPGKNGTGFMFWDDRDHCIYADFFGSYEGDDKVRIASSLVATSEELLHPYSLRIGFHKTEMVARKAMMKWFVADDPEDDKNI
jgi:hypothetical protein